MQWVTQRFDLRCPSCPFLHVSVINCQESLLVKLQNIYKLCTTRLDFFFTGFVLMQHSKVCTFMKACHIITDTVLIRESKRNNKKAQHMAAFEPTTSGSRGVCSTTALEPLPIALCLSWKQCYLMHSFLSFMAVSVDFSNPTNQKPSNECPFVRKTLLEQRSPCREWKRTCSSCVALSVSLSLPISFSLLTH